VGLVLIERAFASLVVFGVRAGTECADDTECLRKWLMASPWVQNVRTGTECTEIAHGFAMGTECTEIAHGFAMGLDECRVDSPTANFSTQLPYASEH
jgi:hypothetical protein